MVSTPCSSMNSGWRRRFVPERHGSWGGPSHRQSPNGSHVGGSGRAIRADTGGTRSPCASDPGAPGVSGSCRARLSSRGRITHTSERLLWCDSSTPPNKLFLLDSVQFAEQQTAFDRGVEPFTFRTSPFKAAANRRKPPPTNVSSAEKYSE